MDWEISLLLAIGLRGNASESVIVESLSRSCSTWVGRGRSISEQAGQCRTMSADHKAITVEMSGYNWIVRVSGWLGVAGDEEGRFNQRRREAEEGGKRGGIEWTRTKRDEGTGMAAAAW